jgi:thymidylate kinase
MTGSKSEKRRAVKISFSGIDGAGKSTQIEMLRSHLIASGRRVHVVTFWDDVAVLTRFRDSASHALFKGEKGVGTPERPVKRRDKNVRSWYMTTMRFVLYFLEALSLRQAAARAGDADVLIFDRYLYDQLANLPIENLLVRQYARFLLALVPRLDIAYLLDADPSLARARKPEYPLEFLNSSRERYMILKHIGGMTMIEPGPVEEVSTRVARRFSERFPESDLISGATAARGATASPRANAFSPAESQ